MNLRHLSAAIAGKPAPTGNFCVVANFVNIAVICGSWLTSDCGLSAKGMLNVPSNRWQASSHKFFICPQ